MPVLDQANGQHQQLMVNLRLLKASGQNYSQAALRYYESTFQITCPGKLLHVHRQLLPPKLSFHQVTLLSVSFRKESIRQKVTSYIPTYHPDHDYVCPGLCLSFHAEPKVFSCQQPTFLCIPSLLASSKSTNYLVPLWHFQCFLLH